MNENSVDRINKAFAIAMRQDGKTYKEIGDVLGVSSARARELFLRAEREKKCVATPTLSTRVEETAISRRLLVALNSIGFVCYKKENGMSYATKETPKTWGDVMSIPQDILEESLRKIENVGSKTINELRDILQYLRAGESVVQLTTQLESRRDRLLRQLVHNLREREMQLPPHDVPLATEPGTVIRVLLDAIADTLDEVLPPQEGGGAGGERG